MAKMIVIAGPPGGGKSTVLGEDYFSELGIPYFNIDTRCKELHGSSQQIPAAIRQQANTELRNWAWDHIANNRTFAFETTLRADFALRANKLAHDGGLETELHYVAAPEDTHWERVRARAQEGGHAASEPTIRAMYKASMDNLPKALAEFDVCTVYDSSGPDPVVQFKLRQGELVSAVQHLAPWLDTPMEKYQQLLSHERESDFER